MTDRMQVGREYVGHVDEWDESAVLTDEEVVRCRNCAYCEKGRDSWHVCNRWNEPLIFADGDGFCSWGERRSA